MAALNDAERHALVARHAEVFERSVKKRATGWLIAAGIVGYLCFAWWFFAVGQIFANGNWDIAGAYLADWISYQVQPDIEFEDQSLAVSFPRFSPLGADPRPDWIEGEKAVVERAVDDASAAPSGGGTSGGQGFLGPMASDGAETGAAGGFLGTMEKRKPNPNNSRGFPGSLEPAGAAGSAATGGAGGKAGAETTVREEAVVGALVTIGTGGTIDIRPGRVAVTRDGEELVLDIDRGKSVRPRGEFPSWAEQKTPGGKVTVSFGFAGRAEIENDEVKIRRRFLGWENFVFDTRSPFWGKPFSEVVSLIVSGERLDPDRSNLALAWDNFLNNAEWQHGDVWLKLLQTIVMAFAGTVLATLLAFPLAFAAARNITPNRLLNQVLKRFFDFQRSVDMLIWALFFTRAFGPGPLAGISAIFFTDTGTFGKLYSEALENIDDKQREGVRSVGAGPVLVQRYGVLPQVLPLFISQSLYFWESNTRSATIIGAVGAGGIGLKLWEAMRTSTDWENVAYMVVLILLVVFVFDNISSFLRHRIMGTAREG